MISNRLTQTTGLTATAIPHRNLTKLLDVPSDVRVRLIIQPQQYTNSEPQQRYLLLLLLSSSSSSSLVTGLFFLVLPLNQR
jgi:hypothetical protein